MAAGSYDITIEQGATFSKTLVYKDSAGVAMDLTTVTVARAQMRATAASATAVNFTVVVSGSPTLGTLLWTMSATNTAALTPTTTDWVYDLEIEYSTGVVKRLIEGSVTVVAEVTRS